MQKRKQENDKPRQPEPQVTSSMATAGGTLCEQQECIGQQAADDEPGKGQETDGGRPQRQGGRDDRMRAGDHHCTAEQCIGKQ